ncbi:MAG: redoxin domain-containing protein [Bacteroidales bacterium]|nr:redoxin domain-containing protein [Bacteroidales bacterium]
MKRILILLSAAPLMAACGSSNEYKIICDMGGSQFDGQELALYDYFTQQPMQTAKVEKGKAVLSDTLSHPFVGMLIMEQMPVCLLIVEPGKISYDAKADTMYGSPMCEKMMAYTRDLNAMNEPLKTIQQKYTGAMQKGDTTTAAAIMNDAMKFYADEFCKTNWRHFDSNKDNMIGAMALTTLAQSASEAGISMATIDSATATASEVVRDFQPLVRIMDSWRTEQQTSAGSKFIDFEGIDFATGQPTTLGAMIKGQLAVVDFWASWCAPCREEIKNTLIALSEKYQNKGVVVVGVDINDQRDRHRQAVESLGITYPQLIDTTANGHAASLYGITGIPHIMLIAPDGTILQRDLRGADIEEAVKKNL